MAIQFNLDDLNGKKKEPEKSSEVKQTPMPGVSIKQTNSTPAPAPSQNPNPNPNPAGFQRYDPPAPQIDMDKLKSEIMQQMKEEEENKKKERERAILEREKELERAEAELKEEKENIANNKKFGRKSKMLSNSAPESNADYYANYQIKIRNQKIKSMTYTAVFIILSLGLLLANVYFIFFKKEMPVGTIEAYVRQDLNVYMFPREGVQEYLEHNLASIIENDVSITGGSGASSWSITEIRVRKLNVFSDELANVFFSADFSTATGSTEHNFIITLYYDYNSRSYSPASPLIARSSKFVDTPVMNKDQDLVWGFGDAQKISDTSKVEEFLTSYFTLLYNTKTIPSAYLMIEDDITFDNADYTFNFIDSVELYNTTNYMGANCKVVYNVRSTEGLSYLITTYMCIVDDGNGSYKITALY